MDNWTYANCAAAIRATAAAERSKGEPVADCVQGLHRMGTLASRRITRSWPAVASRRNWLRYQTNAVAAVRSTIRDEEKKEVLL